MLINKFSVHGENEQNDPGDLDSDYTDAEHDEANDTDYGDGDGTGDQ